jgi:TolA-binding protein
MLTVAALLHRLPLLRGLFALALLLGGAAVGAQELAPDQAADMLLSSARRAYNDKNYPFAAARFREFLGKFGTHKDAPSARYGLALCLLEGPERDYPGAVEQLQPLVGNKDLPEYPSVLYHLGLAQRGVGLKELALAAAKPAEAAPHKAAAQQRFEEAAKQFGAAGPVFLALVKQPDPAAKELPTDLEWACRARCDQAEMLVRLQRPKEAQAAVAGFVADKVLAKSRYRGLGLYYHGFASFLLKDYQAAGRSLSLLAPFADPVFGTHARYLLARVHHQDGERQEALAAYEGVVAGYAKQKQAALEALRLPERFKDDPEEKARLEALVRDAPPDHVARATFFLGVLQYEDGKFADAQARFAEFRQKYPGSPLLPEAQLRQGFCQVQLKQFGEVLKTLQPLVDKEPRLADQALLWIAKAQAGAADPNNPAAHEQALKVAVETFRKAAERAAQLTDPDAKERRGEILLEMADTQQMARLFKDAAATYNTLLNDKLLPRREEEVLQHLADALHLAGDFGESDKICQRFREAHPKSLLLPAVLFRHAENAYFAALAAEKLPNPADRAREVARLTDEAVKRYQVVIDKYPEFQHASLARYGLGMAHYRKGDLDKARAMFEAIPASDRTGDLAIVAYQLADLLLRLAPAKADDAVAAGKLEEALKGAVEQLDAFVSSNPTSALTPDALIKLGHCHQRLAALLVQPPDQAKALQSARAAYDQLSGRFPQHPLRPQAIFERGKVRAQARDINGAINELRRFTTQDPLKNAPIAPLALLHLATLLRGQNQAGEAAAVLAQCRQQHEQNMLKDPERAAWVPLLQYHHGVALREAGKRTEARALFEQVLKQAPDRPEAAEAALRSGQCLKEDGQAAIAEGQKKLAAPNLKPEEQAAARKQIDDGVKELRDAVQFLLAQADGLKQKHPDAPARARMLYEAAWGCRAIADVEIEAVRSKMQQELWQKHKDEMAKKTPPGRQPPPVPMPDVPLSTVPVQPAETQARAQYQALIAAFPDVALNADARCELAELLSDRNEHEAAIKLLREALDKEPGPELTDRIRVRLGNCLLLKGDAKAALGHFQAVAQNAKSPLMAQATYRLGECYLQLNDPAEAVKRLAAFRDKPPLQNVPGVSDRALLRLGHALGQLKQWEPSRHAHEQVVARFGNGPWAGEARYGMGWALQNLQRFDDAVNVYTQVAAATATELAARAQLNIGLCRLAQKRYPEATTALLVVPFTYDYPQLSAGALIEAARAFSENKQNDQAIKLLERVLRDHPDTEQAEVARKRLEELKKG